jgi:methyl-accepting chemotaxis protein
MHDRSLALGRAVSIFKTQGAQAPDAADWELSGEHAGVPLAWTPEGGKLLVEK